MNIIDTQLKDIKILEPKKHTDQRGYFMETYRQEWLQTLLGKETFVQENQSYSHKGVLRGLHYQSQNPQAKLVRVVSGSLFDVAVDIRPNSPTFGRWIGVELSASNQRQLWIPAGFAHGFYVLSSYAECIYKCTQYYHPESEQTLIWNDPQLNIQWPLSASPILSKKDQQGKTLAKLLLNHQL